jgi:uncharacterized protein YeaO (DUF488 family)
MLRFDHACCTLPQTWPSADQSVVVLAMRRPRGWWLKAVRDAGGIWMKEAGPSDSLLDAYRRQVITWEEFAARYRAEIVDERPEVLGELMQLAGEHPSGHLTVMCWERLDASQPHCHRTLLVEMLNSLASARTPTMRYQP